MACRHSARWKAHSLRPRHSIPPPREPTSPDPILLEDYRTDFVGLIYCLAFGEKEALTNATPCGGAPRCNTSECESNRGTSQFWTLLSACARGTNYTPLGVESKHADVCKNKFAVDLLKSGRLSTLNRLKAKLEILQTLKDRGVWLIDTSVIGWYISQPQGYRRSSKTKQVRRNTKERPPKELKAPALVLSWELFTKNVVREIAEEGALRAIIPIGKEVEEIL